MSTARRSSAGIIFDVDGTLAETEEIHRQSFNETFVSMQVGDIWPDRLRGWKWSREIYARLLRTTGGKERIRAYLQADLGLDPDQVSETIAAIHAAKTARFSALIREAKVAPRPGINRIMTVAREEGISLAVATTTTRSNVDALCHALFDQSADQIFDAIASGDEVDEKKPAPDVYNLALRTLQLPPEACIALEDSRNGLLAAKGAGLRCIVSPSLYTTNEDFHEADLLLEEFDWGKIALMLA